MSGGLGGGWHGVSVNVFHLVRQVSEGSAGELLLVPMAPELWCATGAGSIPHAF